MMHSRKQTPAQAFAAAVKSNPQSIASILAAESSSDSSFEDWSIPTSPLERYSSIVPASPSSSFMEKMRFFFTSRPSPCSASSSESLKRTLSKLSFRRTSTSSSQRSLEREERREDDSPVLQEAVEWAQGVGMDQTTRETLSRMAQYLDSLQ